MPRIESQTTINAPAEAVFAYLTDFSRHPEWAGQQLAITPANEGPAKVGSTYSSVGHQMGTHRGIVTVTELVPNQKLVFESDDDTGRFRHTFELKGEGAQTELSKTFEPLQPGAMFRVMSPLILRFMTPKALAQDVVRIKAKVEGAAAT
jgi:uncharacterized protein YndB with AHSA1/START domain